MGKKIHKHNVWYIISDWCSKNQWMSKSMNAIELIGKNNKWNVEYCEIYLHKAFNNGENGCYLMKTKPDQNNLKV